MDDHWGPPLSKPTKKRKLIELMAGKETNEKSTKPWLANCDSSKNVYQKGNHIYFYAGVSKDSVYKLNEHLVKINNDFDDLQRKNPTVTITSKPIYLQRLVMAFEERVPRKYESEWGARAIQRRL